MTLIQDSKRFWPILMANAFYYLFTGMSESVIGKHVYEILPPQLISLQTVIGWGGGILLGLAWSKWGKRMLPLLIPMFTMQIIASVLYFIYSEATLNIFIFWVLGLGMYIFFGGLADKIFDGACAWFFKKSEDRASYDNLIDMVCCITGFSGYLISMIYVPSLRMAILFNFLATFFWCLGVLIYSIQHKSDLDLDKIKEESKQEKQKKLEAKEKDNL